MGSKIYYAKPSVIGELMMGLDFVRGHASELYISLMAHDLDKTHAFLREVEIDDLDEIYYKFQAEIWSHEGEAAGLIRALGLNHTSMSIGDIVQKDGVYYFCDFSGWSLL